MEFQERTTIAICRCWKSKDHPYCDGTHRRLVKPKDPAAKKPRLIAAAVKVFDDLNVFGWSVDLHIDGKNLLEQERRIRALPTAVVIDHIARIKPVAGLTQPAFQLLMDLLKQKHVWVKVSGADKSCNTCVDSYYGLPFVEVIPFAQAVIAVARDRALWGTEWPHSNNFSPGHTPNDGDLVDLLAAFAPEETTRRRILVDNPAALYGFRINDKSLSLHP